MDFGDMDFGDMDFGDMDLAIRAFVPKGHLIIAQRFIAGNPVATHPLESRKGRLIDLHASPRTLPRLSVVPSGTSSRRMSFDPQR